MTELGKERNEMLNNAFKKIDERFFAGFSDEDIERLNGYLDRLIENLTGDLNPDYVMDLLIGRKDEKKECGTAND